MSLLLDALKKSEAQRRRGKAPAVDLATTPPSARVAGPRRRWLMLLLSLVLLAAAGPWLWPELSSRLAGGQAVDGSGEQTPAARGEPRGRASTAPTSPDMASPRAAPSPVAGAGRARRMERGQAGESGMPAEASPEALSMAQQQAAPERLQPAAPGADSASDSKSVSASKPESRTEIQREPQPEPEPESEPEPKPEA